MGLANLIREVIDAYCEEIYNNGHRNHLGASLIGDDCKRKLWYVFRWVKQEQFNGRMLRLFNRGHREEERFIEWLEGIGAKVWADDLQNNKLWYAKDSNAYKILPAGEELSGGLDVSNNKTDILRAKADGVKFPQFKISDCGGHFGGSLDGVCILPERFGFEEPVLLEFKTNSTSGFSELKEKGYAVAKPLHFAQTCTYGFKMNIGYCLYLNVCKNNDEIHAEFVKLDWGLGKQMIAKAERIIISKEAPPKLSNDKTYFKCKWCSFNDICHTGAMAEKNCRSCKFAIPVDNGKWRCELNDIPELDEIDIKMACDSWKSITCESEYV